MRKFLRSFGFAFAGIRRAFVTQLNFRVHITAALLIILLGIHTHLSVGEWLWIVLAIALVLVTELLNTAIELLVDLVSPGFNEKAGAVKDLAAGAVLLSAIAAAVIGLVIFLPKL